MKIGIESTTAIKKLGGISEYSFNLIRALSKIDRKNHYKLVNFSFFRKNLRAMPKLPANFRILNINLPNKIMEFLWQNLNWPSLDYFFTDCDFVFKPHFLGAPVKNKPLVLTIYDLSFYHDSKWFTSLDRETMLKHFKENIAKAKLILTISKYTKNDLINNFKVDPNKIVVTYLGVDDIFKQKEDTVKSREVLEKYNINGPYILYLGTLEPRKNIIGIIDAFTNISVKHPRLKLVLAGRNGWLCEDILSRSKISNKIILTGPVEDFERPVLYQNSEMFVYPSFFEGFGLPPLEAMNCGTPVITSNNSSIPEVVGNAAILVDPKNTSQIADAMKKILDNPKKKQDMIKKGKIRASQFSWEKCASQTLKAFEKVSNENRH